MKTEVSPGLAIPPNFDAFAKRHTQQPITVTLNGTRINEHYSITMTKWQKPKGFISKASRTGDYQLESLKSYYRKDQWEAWHNRSHEVTPFPPMALKASKVALKTLAKMGIAA